jgi:predicted small lipoprotein YifL
MKRLILALAAITFVFLSSGCGQSGPLYISGNPSEIQEPPPAAESTADESTADESTADEEQKEDGDTDKE